MDPGTLANRLRPFFAAQLDVPEVGIEGVSRMAGGASREIWSLDVGYKRDGKDHRLELVLRRDRPGTSAAIRLRDEFELLRAAAAAGVPVPPVHWQVDDADLLGAPFFVMDRIAGETLPRRLLRDEEYAHARAAMTTQLGAALARIHGIALQEPLLGFLAQPEEGKNAALSEVDRYEQIYRYAAPDPHPALELALRWLRQHLPSSDRRSLVHGDFRVGNVIYGPEGLRSVLDWELAHIGDPMEDLAWLCVRAWRFGSDSKAVGGIGDRDELFAAYEAAGGGPVAAKVARYWEILGNFKWAVITIMQAKTHLDGHVHSVELASLGRRTAEVELELLDKIEELG